MWLKSKNFTSYSILGHGKKSVGIENFTVGIVGSFALFCFQTGGCDGIGERSDRSADLVCAGNINLFVFWFAFGIGQMVLDCFGKNFFKRRLIFF